MNTFPEGEDCVNDHDPNIAIEELQQMHFDTVESAKPFRHHDDVDCRADEINSSEKHKDNESHEENSNDNSSSMYCRPESERKKDGRYQCLQSIERRYSFRLLQCDVAAFL